MSLTAHQLLAKTTLQKSYEKYNMKTVKLMLNPIQIYLEDQKLTTQSLGACLRQAEAHMQSVLAEQDRRRFWQKRDHHGTEADIASGAARQQRDGTEGEKIRHRHELSNETETRHLL